MTATTQEEHDMSVAVGIEPGPVRVADAEHTARPVVVRVGPSDPSPRPREAAAGRLVWRTHDTPPVRIPGEAEPEAIAPAERAA